MDVQKRKKGKEKEHSTKKDRNKRKIKKKGGEKWVSEFLKKTMSLECNIKRCKISGGVIIVKLGSIEEKK